MEQDVAGEGFHQEVSSPTGSEEARDAGL
jgi:hypothetical protein